MANGDAWLVPIDGDGDAFTGGTWDVTEFVTEDDDSFQYRLVGTGQSEDTSLNTAVQTLGYSFLASRANKRTDSNDEVEHVGLFSVMNDMLSPSNIEVATIDNIRGNVEDEQDDIPYEPLAS